MSSDREAFYDREIAPALLDLGRHCMEHGLNFLAVVEWSPGEQGRTGFIGPDAGLGICLAEVAARANGNVDSLIIAIMKHATKHGHSSLCLAQLGVPASPADGGRS